MKEKLVIKNFGPIKSVDLDLSKINILIGEQASGKSTVAKVLAVCRFFSYIIEVKTLRSFEGPFAEGLRYWGIESYLQDDSNIYYENNDYSVKVTPKVESVQILEEKGFPSSTFTEEKVFYPLVNSKSQRFENLMKEFNDIYPLKSASNLLTK